jgi:hypothetical protein
MHLATAVCVNLLLLELSLSFSDLNQAGKAVYAVGRCFYLPEQVPSTLIMFSYNFVSYRTGRCRFVSQSTVNVHRIFFVEKLLLCQVFRIVLVIVLVIALVIVW